ncbi:FxLYD domain-containing protein [Saccharibacillus kuerlensis]|uniref:Zinc-ribbon domain-containing protein n=1 Tax=Saccharibacillus kuerlensis TaxID=459527 RepID=A0ABQ2L2W9_9BACL|nr:FxLYD domain-containing protein [Saccharibacillus kuerlensis]GGO00670.1 hypothetical protein GCM10010969_22140 [Saccharibacillus kuerlensis]
MRCIECGTDLPEGSRFCLSCGVRQPESAAGTASVDSVRPAAAGAERIDEMPSADEAARSGEDRLSSSAGWEPFRSGGHAQTPGAAAPDVYAADTETDAPPQMRPVLQSEPHTHSHTPSLEAENGSQNVRQNARPARRTKRGGAAVWIVPPLLAACTAGTLLWQVNYEQGISAEAASIQRSAADAALGGNYEIAESKLGEALERRPDDPGIRSDLETVRTIRRLDDRLTEAQRMLGAENASGASTILDEVDNELAALAGSPYDELRTRLDKLHGKLRLADIRNEAKTADTLDELAGLLKTAAAYPVLDKQPVVQLINERIVEVSGNEAEEAIASGSYYEAAAVVDEARSYVPEAERLIELEKRISSLASEGEPAASELLYLSGTELTAGTGALRMDGFKQYESGGGVVFSGRLINVSAEPMYDLLIEFRAYDAQGSYLGEDWTEAAPEGLAPGESADFSAKIAKAGAGTLVVIDSISWYRE